MGAESVNSIPMPCARRCINRKKTLVRFPYFRDCGGCAIACKKIPKLLGNKFVSLEGINVVENRVFKDSNLVGYADSGNFSYTEALKLKVNPQS